MYPKNGKVEIRWYINAKMSSSCNECNECCYMLPRPPSRTDALIFSLLMGLLGGLPGQKPSALSFPQELHNLMCHLASGPVPFRTSQHPVTGHLGSPAKLFKDLGSFRAPYRLLRPLLWLHNNPLSLSAQSYFPLFPRPSRLPLPNLPVLKSPSQRTV